MAEAQNNPENPPESEAVDSKLNQMLWTKEEARIIGDFIIKGVDFNVQTEIRPNLWESIKTSTDFVDTETSTLISRTGDFLLTIDPDFSLSEKTKDDSADDEETTDNQPINKVSKDEYEYSVKKQSSVILQLAEPTLRYFGILDSNDSRYIHPHGGLRTVGKIGFSQEDLMGKVIEKKGLYSDTEGGPNIIEAIYAPTYETSKNTSHDRTRRSLAHEIQHVLRALSNKSFWEDSKKEAEIANLRKPDTNDKEKNIGGFFVGSNLQGSEAIGELFSVLVSTKANANEEPTLYDVLPELINRLETSTRKASKKLSEGETVRLRYLSAKFALVHHVSQLVNLGYGKIRAADLLSLVTYGFVSFEKAPELIQLGVINQDKYKRMRQVIGNFTNWLSSPSEDGFRINSQNI